MSGPEPGAPRVLLVDDTPANLLALAAALRPIDAELVQATSGAAAIELVATNWFAAILLDVQMPGMDGFETAARIRRTDRGREVPIIFVTAICRDDYYIVRGYEAGAADYITKPYDANVVRARVKAFVDLFRQRERQKRSRLETALEFAPALITILRVPGYECEFANAEYRRLLKDRKVLGMSAAALGAPPPFLSLLDRVAASGESRRVSESPWPLSGAGAGPAPDRFFNVMLQPLRDTQGKVDAVLCFAVETTEHVHARREIEVARAHAEQANRAKDVVLARVSHELRNPLNSILGWTMNARRHDPSPEMQRALDVIERNARAQVRLIDDILDAERFAGRPFKLELGPTNLEKVVEEAVETVRPSADAKGITISIQIERVGMIDGDGPRLQQAIGNVVSNAVKFTDPRGRVDLVVCRASSRIVIRVTDTGEGIEPAFLPYLFEPFAQGESTAGRRNDGLGLGLTIAHEIVRGHGGCVRASSRGKGFGTSIEIDLPCRSSGTENL